MQIFGKRNFYIIVMVLVVCMFSANLSAASMHHMDDSDCMMETTCHHCFISAVTHSPDFKFSFLVISQFLEIQNSFKPNQIAPPSPPPKN